MNIEHHRHTLAHLLAAAVRELYPNAKPTIGPAVDNGFYYDFDNLKNPDLIALDVKMEELLPSWIEFSHKQVSADEAKEFFAGNSYKIELIEEIAAKGETLTLYTCGGFTDLCRGGHSEHPAKDIPSDSFKLTHTAGAYWRGSEKNTMLTRIYGLAFASQEDLIAYELQQEEAKKRDHKKLGRELDIFVFSDLVGPGLPLWTPRGTMMRHLLDGFVWELRDGHGYEKVEIPHITKKELYQTSGHWDKFKDELFRITTREGHEFAMKPMNCPHHTQIYARRKWSYRELPQRYANTTTCYRDEQSGELSGLSRVRAFAQDDAHVFCRMSQVKEECLKVWDIIHEFYPAFGFALTPRLSLRDPNHPEKYLGDAKVWDGAEDQLRTILVEKGVEVIEAPGEAAFYGPKIDFSAKDSLGRWWQLATIQLDMNMPERFDLSCVNEEGKDERIVMIHAAIMGSLERFMSILIEHTAGVFPTWLSPVQVSAIPVSEKHLEYAQSIVTKLKEAGIRAELDDSNETLGKKIRAWKLAKNPYALVIGDKEVESNMLSIEMRNGEKLSESVEAFIKRLTQEIKTRAL